MTPAKKSAAMMRGPLQAILHLRFASAIGLMLLLAPFVSALSGYWVWGHLRCYSSLQGRARTFFRAVAV